MHLVNTFMSIQPTFAGHFRMNESLPRHQGGGDDKKVNKHNLIHVIKTYRKFFEYIQWSSYARYELKG